MVTINYVGRSWTCRIHSVVCGLEREAEARGRVCGGGSLSVGFVWDGWDEWLVGLAGWRGSVVGDRGRSGLLVAVDVVTMA